MGEIERGRGKGKEGCGEKERRKERRSKGEREGGWRQRGSMGPGEERLRLHLSLQVCRQPHLGSAQLQDHAGQVGLGAACERQCLLILLSPGHNRQGALEGSDLDIFQLCVPGSCQSRWDHTHPSIRMTFTPAGPTTNSSFSWCKHYPTWIPLKCPLPPYLICTHEHVYQESGAHT